MMADTAADDDDDLVVQGEFGRLGEETVFFPGWSAFLFFRLWWLLACLVAAASSDGCLDALFCVCCPRCLLLGAGHYVGRYWQLGDAREWECSSTSCSLFRGALKEGCVAVAVMI